MASITRTDTGDGRRYVVNYREPDGRQRRKTFHRKTDADTFASTIEADKARGSYVDPDAGRMTFKRYATDWLSAQTFDETSREIVERQLRLHAFPALGSEQLRKIQPSTIQGWLRGLDVASTSYKKMIFGHVSSVFRAAVDDERITKNPCKAASVRPPKGELRKVTPWTGERVMAVRDAMAQRYRITATLAAGLGLRQGEVFGLAVADVDFLRGSVKVRRQVRLHSDGRLEFRVPKSGKGRSVPLPATIRDALAAHLTAHPARLVTLPDEGAKGKVTSVELVVCTPDGEALRRNNYNRQVWAPALKTVGVESGRDNGIHALRHYYASVLLDAGENIKAVSEYLGHSDAGFTLRTYTHLMPASDERTRKAVDDAFSRYNVVTSASG